MNFSSLSVKRPVTTVMFVMIVLVLGFVSFTKIPIDLYPDIEIPVAIINTTYSNVAPEEIEKLVTRPIEEVVGTVENIDTIQSITTEGTSIVIVQFKFGTDMNFATLKMREKVDLIKGFLPDDASDPMVMQIDPTAQAVVQIALTGSDVATLQEYADSVLKPGLERIKGVASVDISGGYERYVSVKVHDEKSSGYGISIDTITQILAAENINLPAGTVKKGEKELLLRTVGEFESIDDIKNIALTLPTGDMIHLDDVADVNLVNKEATSISKVNGETAVNLAIQKQSGTNTVVVANQIIKTAENFDQNSPFDINIIFNQADYINRSIDQVSSIAVIGGLLAVLILFIFLRSVRSTIIIGTSIPISIIATFVLIYFNGITLNMMTIGGLALGIGMLVDNSVVVLENIYRYMQDGYSRYESAVQGAKEVAMAVTASTLTTIAVFAPLSFSSGITSIMFGELALTVTFSLVSSLVVSLTLVPMMASKLLIVDEMEGKHHKTKFRIVGWILDQSDKIYTSLELSYKNLLGWSLKHRKSIVTITIVVFLVSIGSIAFIGMEFMPETDEGAFAVNIELEKGAKTADTSLAIDKVVDAIIDIEEIEYIFSTTSGNNFLGSSQNEGYVQGVLNPLSERDRSVKQIIVEVEDLIADIPGIKATVSAQSSMGMIGGSPVAIEIKGDDLDVLKDISDLIITEAKKVEGIRNPSSSMADPIPQIEISINRDIASRYALTTAQVSNAVKAVMDGRTATRYKLDGNELDVIIEGDDRYNESIENLKQVMINSPTGIEIPLDLIADIKDETGPVAINRDDQARIVTVSADIYGRDLRSITEELKNRISNLSMPSGYTIDYGGQNQEMVEAFSDLGLVLLLAILLVYMIIAAQFESLLTPFIIMFTTPLAIGGGILGLFITNRTLSITSIIGFVMLAGIVVNNGIVLIDYINTRRGRGEERTKAILNAGPIRLRPILMTTFTTMLGLVPMALGIGEGAELMAPMATVVISGLLISSLLTLVFIPVLYSIFDDVSLKRKRRKKKVQTITN